MKVVYLFILFFCGILTASAQLKPFEGENFAFKASKNVSYTCATIELVSCLKYVSANLEFQGKATTFSGVFGLNFTSGYFEQTRYFIGAKVGVQNFDKNNFAMFGAEIGYEYSPKTMIYGFKLVSDQRSNQEYLLSNNYACVTLGVKF